MGVAYSGDSRLETIWSTWVILTAVALHSGDIWAQQSNVILNERSVLVSLFPIR